MDCLEVCDFDEYTLCSNLSLKGREPKSSSASAIMNVGFSDGTLFGEERVCELRRFFSDLKTVFVSIC